MGRSAVMLRGINVGPSRRVPMADLRALLSDAGFTDVATYVQSGNIVLTSDLDEAALEAEVGRLVSARFGFHVPALARSGGALDAVLAHDPIPGAAQQPKAYQVTFLGQAPSAEVVARLQGLLVETEQLVVRGRELYTFHPEGIARSKLAIQLTARGMGAQATARNWSTVIKLAQMTLGPPREAARST